MVAKAHFRRSRFAIAKIIHSAVDGIEDELSGEAAYANK